MYNSIGALLLIYVVGCTFMSAGAGMYEIKHRKKAPWAVRTYAIFLWPTLPLCFLCMNLWERYAKWQLKRAVRSLMDELEGLPHIEGLPHHADLQRVRDRVYKAIDEL